MQVNKIVLCVLLGSITLAFSEETASASSTTTTTTATTPSTSEQYQQQPQKQEQCDCNTTSTEFENLQDNLDNCLRQRTEQVANLQRANDICSEGNVQLQISLDDSLQTITLGKEKNVELEALIVQLKEERETQMQTALKLEQENKDLRAKVKELESNVHSLNAAQQEKLTQSNDKLTQCHQSLSKEQSNHTLTLAKLTNLEESKSKLTSKHTQKVKELRSQIANINQDLENQKRIVRSTQDRFHDTSEKLTNVDRELLQMHIRAQRTYVNMTLVKEDSMHFVMKNVDRVIVFGEDILTHGKTQEVYTQVKKGCRKAVLDPIMPVLESYVFPNLILVEKQIKKYDAVEGVRRLMISIVENVSTVGMNYLDLTNSAATTRAGPRRLRRKLMGVFRNGKRNAEYGVDMAMRFGMLYVGYKLLWLVVKFLGYLFGTNRKKVTTSV